MKKISSLCVFCGASNAIGKEYLEAGRQLGKMLAERDIQLVFGGGDCGVMGAVAGGVMDNGGRVIGVYPEVLRGLEKEHQHLTELIMVPDMHTRKHTMFYKSDGFIILPGGFGTMDETFEVITWKQLHTHDKPIIFYNQNGYWDEWITLTDSFIRKGFASERTRSLYQVVDKLEDIFTALE